MKKLLTFLGCLALYCPLFAQQNAVLTLQDDSKTIISRHIYGQFAEQLGRCIYDGIYKDGKIRMDVVDALKAIKVPNLRWPGGCYADKYHWRDGVGPKNQRPMRVNTTWGMVPEDNSFGTDEYLKLCELVGCEPYMAGNMGSGSPGEMAQWLEYLNYDGKSDLSELRTRNGHPAPYHVAFWGVGNESWGCGGSMTADYYSSLYKQYANFCDEFPGSPLKKIASGPFNFDYNWTETFMKNVPVNQVWGISLHYYTIPNNWQDKGSATQFDQQEYFNTLQKALRMDEIISTNDGIMSRYDPHKQVGLVVDEWGVWTNPEPGTNPAFLYQQNSLRDALVAASTLNIFNNHADRVKMANLAQSVNVLQSLILTNKDQMLLTPTYYVFELYKAHQDAHLLPLHLSSPDYTSGGQSIPAINASASEDDNGVKHLTLVNIDAEKGHAIDIELNKSSSAEITEAKVLTSGKVTDINTFEQPSQIVLKPFRSFKKTDAGFSLTLPARSVVLLSIKNPADRLTIELKDRSDEHAAFLEIVEHLEGDAIRTKDFKPLVRAVDAYLAHGWQGIIPAKLNNLAWDVYAGTNDKNLLAAAERWAKSAVEQDNNGSNMDTYANILYKSGKKKEAIEWEEKAVKLEPNDPDIAKSLLKMKNNTL